mmetsp:Transcript_20304/g.46126  ORF Transcript_20304/g.46126 Transcript_20304/m.46126 type:complete len:445 (-) Transcript_20304:1439-2773(-)
MSQKIEVSSTMTDAGIPARPSSEPEAEKVIPISFACPWPSLWRRFLSYLWPTVDVALIAALVLTYFPHPLIPSNPSSQEAAQDYSVLFIWLPLVGRLCWGPLHWFLSLVLMPGSVLFSESPLRTLMPFKDLRELVHRNSETRESRREVFLHIGGVEVTMCTPDGVELYGIYFAGFGAGVHDTTIIRMNGNAESFQMQDTQLPFMYVNSGFNILLFDYRGVGRSRWRPCFGSKALGHILGIWRTRKVEGNMLDAWTAYQFVAKEIGVPQEKIVIVGHSMGGAISTKMCAIYRLPCILCNSRSFASLRGIASNLAPLFCNSPQNTTKGRIIKNVAYLLLWASGWEYDSLANWKKVKGRKWLEYCPLDPVISYSYSLKHAIERDSRDHDDGFVELDDFRQDIAIESLGGHKVLRLPALLDYDNHNRLLTVEETVFHLAIMREELNAR